MQRVCLDQSILTSSVIGLPSIELNVEIGTQWMLRVMKVDEKIFSMIQSAVQAGRSLVEVCRQQQVGSVYVLSEFILIVISHIHNGFTSAKLFVLTSTLVVMKVSLNAEMTDENKPKPRQFFENYFGQCKQMSVNINALVDFASLQREALQGLADSKYNAV